MKHFFSVSHVLSGWSYLLACLLSLVCLVSSVQVIAGDPKASEPVKLDRDPDLMGWWKFDDNTGKSATDSSTHTRKGELLGDMTFDQNSTPGRLGRALHFDGQDNLVRIRDYKGIQGPAPRTISVWIKTDTAKGDIVSWGTHDFGQMWVLRFIRGHVGVTPQGGYYYVAADLHDETWHHVAAVVSKAEFPNLHDDVTLYVDGDIAEIDRIGLLDLWPIDTGSESDVMIGKGFKGCLDDLRIYSRALSQKEIQMLHRRHE